MKILIAYFSNTGNTEKVAIAMNEALLEHSIDLLKVKDVESERLQDYELVILGSGIYAGKIHKSVVDLVKNADVLPPKFVLINTHASQGAYQHGFKMVKKKIEACNSVILGEWDCRGENKGIPENMLQQRLNSLPPEERKKAEEELIALKGHPNAKDLADAQKFIKNIIK